MSERTQCPECGKPLPEENVHGLCPACLMKEAMASKTFDTHSSEFASAPPPTPEGIADKFPQFEVTECLGRGGMGVVYKARQKSLNRMVAIKILAPEWVGEEKFAEHFSTEAELLAKMSHPNIVTVFDHGQVDGLFYIVMEYIDGVNLRDLLREGKIEPEQALAIVPPVCEALEYAHDKGVVHCDIKPENILLDREGRVMIADFGIASLVGADRERSGTPPYMSPEQEKGVVDRRADIYALGVVLYEMLTGERPDKDLVAPSKRVEIDVRLDEIVLRALEKEPARRYQTAAEFRTVVQTMHSPSKPTKEERDVRSSGSFWKLLRWVAVLAVVGLIGWYLLGAQFSPREYSGPDPAPPPTSVKDVEIWDAIQLFGVLPDGGGEIYDAEGNQIGKGPAVGPWEWPADEQASTLIFDMPQDVSIDWEIFPEIYVSQTGRPLGGGGSWTAGYLGQGRRIQFLRIPRSYSEQTLLGKRSIPVEEIDLTLRYHPPGRSDAVATFLGPFKPTQATKSEEGFPCTIRPGEESQNSGPAGPYFYLSSKDAPIDNGDYKTVFAYDFEGNRYNVSRHGGGRISGGPDGTTAEWSFHISGVPLSHIAVITLGEHPQRKTFPNIRLRPPGQSPRAYPPYLSAMAEALGLGHLSKERLLEYEFTDLDEVVKVIETLEGPHMDQAWQLLERANFGRFNAEQITKLKIVARDWMAEGRLYGILIGLEGKWPEFIDPALDYIENSPTGQWRRPHSVIHPLKHVRAFTPEQLDRVARIIENSGEPRRMLGLFFALKMSLSYERDGGIQALQRLARNDESWIWWEAMEILRGSRGLTFAEMGPDLQVKYLASTDTDKGRDASLVFDAQRLLARLPSSKLAAISTNSISEVLDSVVRNLPRAEAEVVLLDLLEDLLLNWRGPQYRSHETPWWSVSWVVSQLNQWHDLNLGGLGSTTAEKSAWREIEWRSLTRKTHEQFGRELPTPLMEPPADDSPRLEILRIRDALGNPLSHATFVLRPAKNVPYQAPPLPVDGGKQIRVKTDSEGRLKVTWPVILDGMRFSQLVGTVSHPDYGTGPVALRDTTSPQTVPLFPKDSQTYQQALRGQVIDPSGRPVAGAHLSCQGVEIDERRYTGKGKAVADSTGRFVLPFLAYSRGTDERPIPEDAVYELIARAPHGADWFPVRARGSSVMTVMLQEPTLAPRQLRFEIGGSKYAKQEDLEYIRMEWKESADSRDDILLGAHYVSSDPVRLRPGRYRAYYASANGQRRFEYLPVDVDASSPEIITFKRPPHLVCSGQVVSGIGGQPVDGAFVFLPESEEDGSNPAMLTTEDWDLLEKMVAAPSLEDPGVKILAEHYEIEAIVRTDTEGRFTIERKPEDEARILHVLARDHLPYRISLSHLEPDQLNQLKVPKLELFPAGYLQFTARTPVGTTSEARIQYQLTGEKQPPWVDRLKASPDNVPLEDRFGMGEPTRVFAPAGVDFKWRFGEVGNWKAKPSHETLNLVPGEVHDLGVINFVEVEDELEDPKQPD